MTLLANRRSAILLFSLPNCLESHRTRIVIKEKEISAEIHEIDLNAIPEEVKILSPYDEYPSLVDRELVLQNSRVIIEYLDERFPHPPLLPVYPVARAESRLYMYRIERDWSRLVNLILSEKNNEDCTSQARRQLRKDLIRVAPIFDEKPYFMSDDFTMVDCCLAPILWRLPLLGIDIKYEDSRSLYRYMNSLFSRSSFKESLSEAEQEMHPD